MHHFISYIKNLPFWYFISLFVILAIVLSECLIVIQSFIIHGEIHRDLIIVGFFTPLIDAFIVLFITALVLRKLKITEEKLVLEVNAKNEAISALKNLADHDPLTKLPNRRKLKTDFEFELARADRFNRKMGLFYMDLNNFKIINDQFGHDVGDLLLHKVSESINNSLRDNEFIYRVGGDEFCLFIPEFEENIQLENLSNRVIKQITDISKLDKIDINIGCSIGIAIFPYNGSTLSELISAADSAMYKVKKTHKNNFHFAT